MRLETTFARRHRTGWKETMARPLRSPLVAAGVFLLAAGGWWGLGLLSPAPPATAENQIVPVKRRTLRRTVLATGTVKPMVGAEVKVGARLSGKVERLNVQVGDRVRKGQVIALIENEDLKAKVTQSRANLAAERARLAGLKAKAPKEIARAEAELAESDARRQHALLDLKRHRALLAEGITPRETFDAKEKEMKVLEAQVRFGQENLRFIRTRYAEDLKLAAALVDQAAATLQEREINLSYATVRAPIGGVVASISTQEGETVAAGLNAPTFVNIIDLARLEVHAFVDETDIGRISVAQETTFTVDTFPDKPFRGHVTAIYPKALIVDNVVTYEVILAITDSFENLLRPEMTTNVTIITEARPGILAIPRRAVKTTKGQHVVTVVADGARSPRPVELGVQDGAFVEVVSGLSEGEQVVVTGPGKGADHRWLR
ncbi:MAG: efflux RND transporter periplasmic adaptor subunit [bacterium]|nr:efflux RND transporter periplasmic adaptor subunit [bacterium]